jgi:hypothetical protein
MIATQIDQRQVRENQQNATVFAGVREQVGFV